MATGVGWAFFAADKFVGGRLVWGALYVFLAIGQVMSGLLMERDQRKQREGLARSRECLESWGLGRSEPS